MRTLSLFRHAKSSWSNLRLSDYDRPLNGRGKKAASAMADFMVAHKIAPDLILCSAAKRTRQTLELTLDKLSGEPEIIYDETLYLAAPRDIVDLVKSADEAHRHIMVIGHNPGLHALALLLLDSGTPQDIASLSAKFPTAALAVLDFSTGSWQKIANSQGHLRLYMIPKAL